MVFSLTPCNFLSHPATQKPESYCCNDVQFLHPIETPHDWQISRNNNGGDIAHTHGCLGSEPRAFEGSEIMGNYSVELQSISHTHTHTHTHTPWCSNIMCLLRFQGIVFISSVYNIAYEPSLLATRKHEVRSKNILSTKLESVALCRK